MTRSIQHRRQKDEEGIAMKQYVTVMQICERRERRREKTDLSQ
jgi:hypothetical protein